MEITIKTKYTVTYAVEYFEATEGGMDSETFKKGLTSIEKAIDALDIAEMVNTDVPWMITCDVSKQGTGIKEKENK